MRILQLCSKVPYPAKDGGSLAMLNLAEMMHEHGFQVKILSIETPKHPSPSNGYPSIFKQKFSPESVFIDTHAKIIPALRNLFFSQASYHLERFNHKNFEEKLIATIHNYKPQIVVLDSLFTCGYIDTIRAISQAKIIYRAHNIEHLIWQEISLKTKSFLKKKYLSIQSSRLKKEEMQLITNCDGILAITSKDYDFFKLNFQNKRLMTLPFTIDVNQYHCNNQLQDKAIFFIGAMDWYPNLEGVKWFIDMVWDKVLKVHPTAKFMIAGKAMPGDLKNLEHKNIINLGEVADAKKFMEKYPMMVAPIFSGGGLKIKIIEAMAMGKIVVCNPQAATGIQATHQKNILFANSSQEFVSLINECLSNLPEQIMIGKNARLLVEEHFNSATKAEDLKKFLIQ